MNNFDHLSTHQRDFGSWVAEQENIAHLDQYLKPGSEHLESVFELQEQEAPFDLHSTRWIYQTQLKTNTTWTDTSTIPLHYVRPLPSLPPPTPNLALKMSYFPQSRSVPGHQYISKCLLSHYYNYIGDVHKPSWWDLSVLDLFRFIRTIQGLELLTTK